MNPAITEDGKVLRLKHEALKPEAPLMVGPPLCVKPFWAAPPYIGRQLYEPCGFGRGGYTQKRIVLGHPPEFAILLPLTNCINYLRGLQSRVSGPQLFYIVHTQSLI